MLTPLERSQAAELTGAAEVKSGRAPLPHRGFNAFILAFKLRRTLPVGGDGVGSTYDRA